MLKNDFLITHAIYKIFQKHGFDIKITKQLVLLQLCINIFATIERLKVKQEGYSCSLLI